eukprot:scaffold22454_cov58-Cyclotella_meneghiniana.AAC.2
MQMLFLCLQDFELETVKVTIEWVSSSVSYYESANNINRVQIFVALPITRFLNLSSQLQPQGIELDAEKFQLPIEIEDSNSIPGILKATAEILYPELLQENEQCSILSAHDEELTSGGEIFMRTDFTTTIMTEEEICDETSNVSLTMNLLLLRSKTGNY